MSNSAEIVLKKCLGLKRNEKLLIITDSKLYSIAKMFFDDAKKITNKSRLIKISIPKVHGTEPSEKVAEEMLKYAQHARAKGLINTPSYHQVVQPLYSDSLERWRAYEKYLAPYREILKPTCEQFGYKL